MNRKVYQSALGSMAKLIVIVVVVSVAAHTALARAETCQPLAPGQSLQKAAQTGGCFKLGAGIYDGPIEVTGSLTLRSTRRLGARIRAYQGAAVFRVASGGDLRLIRVRVEHKGGEGDGIRVEKKGKLWVQESVISAGGGAGVRIGGGTTTVDHCVIEHNRVGIRVVSGVLPRVDVTNTLFRGNRNQALDIPTRRRLRRLVHIRHSAFYRNGIEPSNAYGLVGVDPMLKGYKPKTGSPLLGAGMSGSGKNERADNIGIYPARRTSAPKVSASRERLVARITQATEACSRGEVLARDGQPQAAKAKVQAGLKVIPRRSEIEDQLKAGGDSETAEIISEAATARTRCTALLALLEKKPKIDRGPESASPPKIASITQALETLDTLELEPCLELKRAGERPGQFTFEKIQYVVARLEACHRSKPCREQIIAQAGQKRTVGAWLEDARTLHQAVDEYVEGCQAIQASRSAVEMTDLVEGSIRAHERITQSCQILPRTLASQLAEPCRALAQEIYAWHQYARGIEALEKDKAGDALHLLRQALVSQVPEIASRIHFAVRLAGVEADLEWTVSIFDHLSQIPVEDFDDQAIEQLTALHGTLRKTGEELEALRRAEPTDRRWLSDRVKGAADKRQSLKTGLERLIHHTCTQYALEASNALVAERWMDTATVLSLVDPLTAFSESCEKVIQKAHAKFENARSQAAKRSPGIGAVGGGASLDWTWIVIVGLLVGAIGFGLIVAFVTYAWRRRYGLVRKWTGTEQKNLERWRARLGTPTWWMRLLRVNSWKIYAEAVFASFDKRWAQDEMLEKAQSWLLDEFVDILRVRADPNILVEWPPLLDEIREKARADVHRPLVEEHLFRLLREIDLPDASVDDAKFRGFWESIESLTMKASGDLARLLEADAWAYMGKFSKAVDVYYRMTGPLGQGLGPAMERLSKMEAVPAFLQFADHKLALGRPEKTSVVWLSEESNRPRHIRSERVVVDVAGLQSDNALDDQRVATLVEDATDLVTQHHASYVVLLATRWNKPFEDLCKALQEKVGFVVPLTASDMVRVARNQGFGRVIEDYLHRQGRAFIEPPRPVSSLADVFDGGSDMVWLSNHLIEGAGAPFPLLVGLRKTGKTSLVWHWMEARTSTKDRDSTIYVYLDLLRRPGPLVEAKNWLPYRLYHEIERAMTRNKVWSKIWKARPKTDPPRPELYTAEDVPSDTERTLDWLYQFLEESEHSNLRFVFFIDEAFDDVERHGEARLNNENKLEICPRNGPRPPWESFRTLVPLLQGIHDREVGASRSEILDTSGFYSPSKAESRIQIYLLAHNDWPARAEKIQSPGDELRPNPLDGLLKPRFIHVMDRKETTEMLYALAALEPEVKALDDEAVEQIYRASGGHPYFARAILARDYAKNAALRTRAIRGINALCEQLWTRDFTQEQKRYIEELAQHGPTGITPVPERLEHEIKTLVDLGILSTRGFHGSKSTEGAGRRRHGNFRCEVLRDWVVQQSGLGPQQKDDR